MKPALASRGCSVNGELDLHVCLMGGRRRGEKRVHQPLLRAGNWIEEHKYVSRYPVDSFNKGGLPNKKNLVEIWVSI